MKLQMRTTVCPWCGQEATRTAEEWQIPGAGICKFCRSFIPLDNWKKGEKSGQETKTNTKQED